MAWGLGGTLAIELGCELMRVALVDADGRVLRRHQEPTPRHTDCPGAVAVLVRGLKISAASSSVVVGVPGRVDYRTGSLTHTSHLLGSWVPWVSERNLAEILDAPVALANRADLGAVGEAWFGAGRTFRDMLYLDVTAGIGAGVVLGRRLVHGRCSLAEAGQMVLDRSALRSGRPATLGALGSGAAMNRLASITSLDILWPEVAALVRTRDPTACGVWHEVTEAIALGVANLAHLFSPEVIVVGGGIDRTGDLLLEPLKAGLRRHGPVPQPIQTQVQGGALGDDACLLGAAAWHEAFNPEAVGRDEPEDPGAQDRRAANEGSSGRLTAGEPKADQRTRPGAPALARKSRSRDPEEGGSGVVLEWRARSAAGT